MCKVKGLFLYLLAPPLSCTFTFIYPGASRYAHSLQLFCTNTHMLIVLMSNIAYLLNFIISPSASLGQIRLSAELSPLVHCYAAPSHTWLDSPLILCLSAHQHLSLFLLSLSSATFSLPSLHVRAQQYACIYCILAYSSPLSPHSLTVSSPISTSMQ